MYKWMIVQVYFHYEIKVFNVVFNCEYQNNNAILKIYVYIFIEQTKVFNPVCHKGFGYLN